MICPTCGRQLDSTASSRDNVRAALRAMGGTLFNSDSRTDWFTMPSPNVFYDRRHSLPFQALYCHGNEGGLVVYYDRPN